MLSLPAKTRIAVLSPFLDKQHGTERCVVEQVARLACKYEVHVYSNRVEELDLSRIVWHRVPALPGPHLFAYCWWLLANRLARWWGRGFGGLRFALTFSPGVNCFDADVIACHMCFAEFLRLARDGLKLGATPVRMWPRLLHRRIYYRLAIALEHLVYGGKSLCLTAISRKVGRDLTRYGKTESEIPVIYHGIDPQRFSAEVRGRLRPQARRELDLQDGALYLLLVGNDWRKKGLDAVLEALGKVGDERVRLLVVGQDVVEPYRATLSRLDLQNRVTFLPLRQDVEFYYAAADVYVGPSLEDGFALPPFEAMACGVPSIVSSQAGVSEIITEGADGFILDDPHDSRKLAELIRRFCQDPGLRQQMGEAAAKIALKFTWERNVQQLDKIFEEALQRKEVQYRLW